MEAQRITVALIDRSGGYEASPDRVRLSSLVDFAGDVATFLRGDTKEVDPQGLDVAIRSGSLAIETVPIAAPKLLKDLQHLAANERLDAVDAKRRSVFESWQKLVKKNADLSFRISAPFLSRPIVVSRETDFHADDADQWVQVERYVRGEVQNLGGTAKPNAHVRLPDGSTLLVTAERDALRDDTSNRLYKIAMLRIRAEYNVLTRELRNARLVEFVEYAPRVDEEELARLNRRGQDAWKDVGNATEWVDQIRGGEH
ncbi:MAG TPA: hypothetical protein VLG41_01485 [Hydrogenophaga sp.]|uniref:hypothetical protein n=1 Tax=Hydrogenophaga sp. TaxID=1904254 RepID=UPI002B908021|nr:hypothetical protein [Hydrogenophaga sp.]HSX91563.1 hypothetical protein [Hydrogenophaga sp.]